MQIYFGNNIFQNTIALRISLHKSQINKTFFNCTVKRHF